MTTIAEAEAAAPVLAASISTALADALYPPADPQVLACAALTLAQSGNRLNAAIGDLTRPLPLGVRRDAQALLLRYGAAVQEAGSVDKIVARLLLWADWADAAASRHEVNRADFAARLEKRRANTGWWLHTVEELERTVAASERLVAEHKASAASFRAQADDVRLAARQAA